jgi:CzcA family heavy metal efflux pump
MARPLFGLILLATVLLVIFGVVAMLHMPRGIYPEVAFPRITVITQAPGLAVKTVEISITRPLEEAVGVVLGVAWVRSKTLRGAAQVDVGFSPGSDMVQALNDVRAKVANVSSQFPPGTSSPLIERQTPSIFPIISFAVTGGRDPSALREYAYYDLRPRISRLQDVSLVEVRGGDVREIVVEVEPARLAAAGLSIADVADRLSKAHRLGAVGRMDRGRLQYQVLVDSQVGDPLDLEELPIGTPGGRPLRVRDLGRVILSHEDRTMAVSANGRDAVSLTVFRRLGGDAMAISAQLGRVLAEARKAAPPGIRIVPIYDQGLLVRTSIANVRDAMLVGGLLSVLVLLAFLKSLRATILTALSIPLSLVISLLFLHLTGDSLNLMSLGGLAVAIGLIIDDSVVVIENIARHLSEGQSGDEAVDRASREISGAVIGSTLTTILVFLPLAFVRGVIGQFFQSLSLALAIAVLVSMVVSLTLIPVLAARFLGRRGMPASGPIYAALADSYEGLLRLGLRFPRSVVLAALLAVLPGWWIFQHLSTGFMPEMDEGAFVLDYFLPSGTSLAETDRVAHRIDKILDETPGVAGYLRNTGTENGLYATEAFRGDILVSLQPAGRRPPIDEIFDKLRKKLKEEVPGADTELVKLVQDQINDLRGVTSPVEVKLFGPDVATLRRLAGEVGKIVEETGAVDVNTHVHVGSPDLVVRPKEAALAASGMTAEDVQKQLAAALYGQVVSTLPQQDRMVGIRVRYPDRVRFDRPGLGDLPIELPDAPDAAKAAAGGGPAPPRFVLLGQAADIQRLRSPSESWRENQQPVITVSAELGKQDLGSVHRKLQAALAKLDVPIGYRWELAGNFLAQQETFASLLAVLLSASALVFLLLGFQFRSLVLPLLIFLAQPVSLASALAALWITGTPLNVSSFMGAILLIGLDVKNGIILIEYIGQLRRSGLALEEALIRAGRTRFRPILMTGLTTIFGLLPLAFGFGPGAQMQQPLAVAVIGGLVVNTLLTRLLIPVGYLVLRRE